MYAIVTRVTKETSMVNTHRKPTDRKIATATRAGFTLLELSLVLSVIGLLSGAILSVKSITRSSQLFSITTDAYTFSRAIDDFKAKYDQLPGDMVTASDYWGTACGTATINHNCNGNGDAQIKSVIVGTGNEIGEDFKIWRHLAFAGLVDGTFKQYSLPAVGGNPVVNPRNTPKSETIDSFWLIKNDDVSTYLRLGENLVGSGAQKKPLNKSNLRRVEALQIDNKIDDGNAKSGKVRCGKCDTDYGALELNGGNPDAKDVFFEFMLL
jgi:prepilin-type N-terminal cleavage/methylation domain-containing protein